MAMRRQAANAVHLSDISILTHDADVRGPALNDTPCSVFAYRTLATSRDTLDAKRFAAISDGEGSEPTVTGRHDGRPLRRRQA